MLYEPLPIGRVCRKCGLWNPYHKLKKHKHQPDGVEALCLACHRTQGNRYFRDNHEAVLQKHRDEYAQFPDRVKERNARSRSKPEHRKRAIVRANRWTKENPERTRANKLRWRQTHPEQSKMIQRKCYKRRRDYYIQCSKEYANAHPEQRRKIYRKSNEKRRDTLKVYRQIHRQRYNIHAQNRRARARALPATFSAVDWENCLNYWNHRCAVCGRPAGLWHSLAQDHWIPVAAGGGYTPTNIVPLCHGLDGCNNSKSDSDPIEWLNKRLGPSKAQATLKRIQNYFDWIESGK